MSREKKQIYVTRSSMPSYEEYCKAIKPLWESRRLTNMGQYHQELEERLAQFLHVPQISLMVNGHMALELTIQAFDFPEGGEVITTPFTFVSTTHAIVRNHLQPVFCDVRESDGVIDENKIEDLITPNTVAILPVHVYGHVCNTDVINDIAKRYGLKTVYDAAHAFGETLNDVGIGNFGDASVFSFHATKVYNTIEGGAVVCNNKELFDRLYDLKNFGIRGEELVVSVGSNAKMNEFSAIMGLLNLDNIDRAITDRKRVCERYREQLINVKGIEEFGSNEINQFGLRRNYAYYPILVKDSYSHSRDELYDLLLENGIHARKYFYPLTSDQVCFKNRYRNNDLSIAREIAKRVLVLPVYEDMANEDIDTICEIIQ